VMAQNLESSSPSNGAAADPGVEGRETAFYLAAAVATRDQRAALALHDGIESNRVVREAIADLMLTHRSRRWRDGVTTESAARAQEALVYGFLLIRRFDRSRCTADEYAGMAVRLFDACTVSDYVPEAPDYRDSLLVPSRIPHLDGAKRVAIAEAAAHVYEEAGWQGLTMVAVAERAGVSRPTVVANFKDRRGLAAAVWSRNLPELRSATEQEVPLPVGQAVHAHVERLATVARRDRTLSAAFIEGVFAYAISHGAPIPDDPADPRTLVPLPQLIEPAIQQHALQFRPGNADSDGAVSDTATLLTDQGLQLAMTHPSLSATGVAERVCSTTLAGMMKRRPNP
jgi:AcrR family transcriptional regulator